jgi:hypothetical protein
MALTLLPTLKPPKLAAFYINNHLCLLDEVDYNPKVKE